MARIIFESNKCNNIELEERDITIDDNGTYAITPNEGYAGMSKVDVNVGVDTLQGLNFEGVYDVEQANEKNLYYKDAIWETKRIIASYSATGQFGTRLKREPFYLPDLDYSNVVREFGYAFQYSNLIGMPSILTLPNCNYLDWSFANVPCEISCDIYFNHNIEVSIIGAFSFSLFVKKVRLFGTRSVTNMNSVFTNTYFAQEIFIENVESVVSFSDTFTNIGAYSTPKNVKISFARWKQASISISRTSQLTSESIHYIIQNAVDVADGATARTLTLHATAKANWQNSEYYEQDLAVLSTKGITIA